MELLLWVVGLLGGYFFIVFVGIRLVVPRMGWFDTDLKILWNRKGFAHCMVFNYALFVLLAGSKYFKAEDIKPVVIFYNFFIHQYLKVRVGDKWIYADPAITYKPFKVGDRSKAFG